MESAIRSVEATDVDDPQMLASIWVRSTAIRDGSVEPGDVSAAVAGIRRRLEVVDACVLEAERSGTTVGFALGAPQGDVFELFYLAVDPEVWGQGIATHLLRAVDSYAGSVGCETCVLWVIERNERAIGVYENAGWIRTDDTQTDVASGRVERRLIRRTPRTRGSVEAVFPFL